MYLLYGTLVQSPKSLSDLSIHHCIKNHELLVHRLDTVFPLQKETVALIISCNLLKFSPGELLSYEFLKMTIFF